MKVTLLLLASDARTALFGRTDDCVAARALGRVLGKGFLPNMGVWTFGIIDANKSTVWNDGRLPGDGFGIEDMKAMAKSGKDRKIRVEIPREFLNESFQPKPRKDKYELAIDKLCKMTKDEIVTVWNNPVIHADNGGVIFSYLTTAPAGTGDRYNGSYSGFGLGCVSQVYNDDYAINESLKAYIKSRPIKTAEQIGDMKTVRARRKALNEYAKIQRAMDICFRFKTPNVVKV